MLSDEVQRELTAIARRHLAIPTLAARNADHLDFHEVSVWAVESALKEAFELGQRMPQARGDGDN